MNPDFFARNIPLANHLIKSEPGKEDKRKDKNRLPALLQQSKINEEDLTPEERERRERERRLNSNQLRFMFSRKTLRSVKKRYSPISTESITPKLLVTHKLQYYMDHNIWAI